MKSHEDERNVIVLEHCTKAKKNGGAIPDRLYHHRVSSIRQVNPLIAPYTWENHRPSGSSDGSLDWKDTYDLVCNAAGLGAASVFPVPAVLSPSRKTRTGPGTGHPPYLDVITNKNNPPRGTLGEVQKLCVVLRMRDGTNDSHLDFTYSPVHCEYSQCSSSRALL